MISLWQIRPKFSFATIKNQQKKSVPKMFKNVAQVSLKRACSFIMFLLYKTYEITNRAERNKQAGLEKIFRKIFGFIIKQAKNFASRVAKNRKSYPSMLFY